MLLRLIRERALGRYQTWLETRSGSPREWREAAGESQHLFHLTAEELKQLNNELSALLMSRFHERLTDPSQRPPGAVPVEMLVISYPVHLPPPETDTQTAGADS